MRRNLTAQEAAQLARLVAKSRVAAGQAQSMLNRRLRDEFVLALLEVGASPSAIAEAGGLDRATIYRIKTTNPGRLHELEQQDAEQ
jgi:DNA invertase Pin-like site-specific DNA recombinase